MNQHNVKRIYFEENYTTDDQLPFFEMEDGTIKKPYRMTFNGGWRTEWLNKAELAVRHERKRLWEIELKEKNKNSWWLW